jgi:hypothetical protein
MNTSTAVNNATQPSESLIQSNQQYVRRLVECGNDNDAATSLVERLTAGSPADKSEVAAMNSFMNLLAALSSSGGRLTLVA